MKYSVTEMFDRNNRLSLEYHFDSNQRVLYQNFNPPGGSNIEYQPFQQKSRLWMSHYLETQILLQVSAKSLNDSFTSEMDVR